MNYHPDYDEAQRQGDEKIRHLGWTLLLLWTFVICWITKEYWFPHLFSHHLDDNDQVVSTFKLFREKSQKKKQQRLNSLLDIEEKRKHVELLQQMYLNPELYYSI